MGRQSSWPLFLILWIRKSISMQFIPSSVGISDHLYDNERIMFSRRYFHYSDQPGKTESIATGSMLL